MILEGLLTSLNADGSLNIAPMGPIVDEQQQSLLLRPFQTSATFQNLQRERCGVFHVVDDVLMIVEAAVGQIQELPDTIQAVKVPGHVISSACRWLEFIVDEIDDSTERAKLTTHVVHQGQLRPFFGYNRARHLLLEIAILATRVHILSEAEIRTTVENCKLPIQKNWRENQNSRRSIYYRIISNLTGKKMAE